jgi:hypothetical protein
VRKVRETDPYLLVRGYTDHTFEQLNEWQKKIVIKTKIGGRLNKYLTQFFLKNNGNSKSISSEQITSD